MILRDAITEKVCCRRINLRTVLTIVGQSKFCLNRTGAILVKQITISDPQGISTDLIIAINAPICRLYVEDP